MTRLSASRKITYAACLAAVYAVLTLLQNLLLPGSASLAIQVRLSEVLCVLAFFTPAAPMGLALGCLIFNLISGAGLPLDFLVGSLATYVACKGMWHSRNLRICGLPLLGLLLPAISNGLLVGWELTHYIGSGFWLNASYVAIGEAIALLGPGTMLYTALRRRRLTDRKP